MFVKTSDKSNYAFLLSCILFLCANAEGIRQMLTGYFTLILLSFLLVLFRYKRNIINSCDKYQLCYLCLMLIGFISHIFIGVEHDPFRELFSWSLIVILLSIYNRYYRYSSNLALGAVLMLFYLCECSFSFYERLMGEIIIPYEESDYMSVDDYIYNNDLFRSSALLFHPLLNANVISIFMGFIFVMKKISNPIRVFLLCIGVLALWGTNSRGVIVIWCVIFFLWFLFNKRGIWFYIIMGIILFLFVPMGIELMMKHDILGRLSEGLVDTSSGTRILAFSVFASHDWNILNIIFGGDILYMPSLFNYKGKELTIENGVLLTLGYWGWIVGTIKIILELIISYNCLTIYNFKERIIVMLATWGVAFTNNNCFNPEMMSFFVLAYMLADIIERRKKV